MMLKRTKPLLKPRTPDTMAPEDIVAKFADALEKFYLIDGQSYNTDLTRIREVVAPLLLQIPYNKTRGTHNLIGPIQPVAAYATRYGTEFAEPTQVGTYNATINDDATVVVRARTEVAHKAKRAYRGTYEMERRYTAQFIIAVVEDTWVREL